MPAMSQIDHYQAAEGSLAAAEAYRRDLTTLYARSHVERRSERVAALHQAIGFALKAAQVHATLATVQR
jgi:hypothetical protein